MTCCIVGKHPSIADIDRLIRAQQAASLAGNATSAPSYSQIARTYGVTRPSLLRHRDECLTVDRGALSEVGSDEIAGDSATLTPVHGVSNGAPHDVDRGVSTRDGQGGPSGMDSGVHARRGQATGPPSDGTDRHDVSRSSVPDAAQSVPSRVAQHGAGVVGQSQERGGEMVEGQGRPSERSRPEPRARARTPYAERWDREGLKSVDVATDRIMHAIADSEIADPNAPRAHGSYVHEIVELVHSAKWEGEITASRLAREWQKPKLFVLGCFHDACAVMRTARGGMNEEREVSLARWMSIYRDAKASDEKGALKVAAEALKGYDAASGLVDKGTKVNLFVAQSEEAKLFVQIYIEEARSDPALLERIRRRMEAVRDKLGDPTALLTTGEVAE